MSRINSTSVFHPPARPYTPLLQSSKPSSPSILSTTRANTATPRSVASTATPVQTESRPILWGAADLGPDHGAAGCGGEGTTAVLDRVGPWNFRPACDGHDACSTPLDQRVDKSFGELAQCQWDFAKNLYNSGPDTWWGRLGGAAFATLYTPVVATVAAGQWIGSRVMDACRSVGSFASSIWNSIF